MSKLTLADLFPVAVDLELKHPVTGESLGVTLKVVGPESSQYRATRNTWVKRLQALGDKTPDAEEVQAASDKLTACQIVGWTDDEFFGSPYTPERALEIVANPGFAWLTDQVQEFTKERANFFSSK